MSASQMLQPVRPCAGWALGAAASHWLSAPLSSPSTWEQVVQRSFVERDHGLHRLDNQREQAALAVVEEQRLVGVDQELVEGEAGRPDGVHEGREPVDVGGDLGDGGFHRGLLWRVVGKVGDLADKRNERSKRNSRRECRTPT
jgi:hypothetical protein